MGGGARRAQAFARMSTSRLPGGSVSCCIAVIRAACCDSRRGHSKVVYRCAALSKGRVQRAWIQSAQYQIIIEVIQSARTSRGISQRRLSQLVGKPPTFINKIELLERRLDALEFVAIAHALEVPVDELLNAIEKKLPSKLIL